MKKQKNNLYDLTKCFLAVVMLFFGLISTQAQTDITSVLGSIGGQKVPDAKLYKVPCTKNYYDVIIPKNSTMDYLYLRARGGDGGYKKATSNANGKTWGGGSGAMVETVFKVGSGQGAIPYGSTIRFMVGEKGNHKSSGGNAGAGGGGGTGIAYLDPHDNNWTLLMVAGGGGGGHGDCCAFGKPGDGGKKYETGKEGPGTQVHTCQNCGGAPGANAFGNSYTFGNSNSHNTHSQGGWPSYPEGEPTGGDCVENSSTDGGWGFGAGGDGSLANKESGGGGGFTGGREGTYGEPADGGTSYLNEDLSILHIHTEEYGHTTDPHDGYVYFQLFSDPEINITNLVFQPQSSTNPLPNFAVEGTWNGTLVGKASGPGPMPIFFTAEKGLPITLPGKYTLKFYSTAAPASYFSDKYTIVYQFDGRAFAIQPKVTTNTDGQNASISVTAFADETLRYSLYKISTQETKVGENTDGTFTDLASASYKLKVNFDKNDQGKNLVATISLTVP